MSGHSKWSTIKRKKGAADAKRGKIFTKLIREIATAARLGGPEPDANPRLRLAVEKSRGANMPKDNITRAIKKGTGGGDSDAFEEVVYEGYGPGGAAIYLEALTDNKNRTVGEVRHVLTKYGGNLGASGCVAYLFEKHGRIHFEGGGLDLDRLFEAALEAGADDAIEEDEGVDVVVKPGELDSVKGAIEAQGFTAASAEICVEPNTTVSLDGERAASMLALADALDDLDDIQNVYANYDISEEEMSRLAG